MARDDPHGRFHAMVRDAAPHTREISVPVYTPERSSLTGKYASESRDFWAMIGIGVFCAVVPFVGFILGLAAGEAWSWLILVAVAGGLLAPFIFYRWTIHGRINAVMVAIFDVEPQPPTPAPEPAADLRFFSTASGTRVAFPAGWDNDLLVRWAKECVRRRFDMAHRTWHPRSEGKTLSRNLFDALLGMLAGQGHYADGELTDSGRRIVTAWADGKTDAV